MNVLDVLRIGPVIPVIVIEELAHAVPLAKALLAGGVRVLEITLRSAVALDAIRVVAHEVPEAIVGAGTLTRPQDFAAAQAAGARFAVSPGLTPALIEAAQETQLPLLPGVMTPSDTIAARLAGWSALKLFPAQQAGGVGMLKALRGPFPDVLFCPTGGVSPDNAREFLALPNVACVGGSWLTPRDALVAGEWDKITALAQEASALGPH